MLYCPKLLFNVQEHVQEFVFVTKQDSGNEEGHTSMQLLEHVREALVSI